VTWWSQWRRGRFWVEIVLAVAVGVAAFVVAALVSTAARSHVPAVLLGPLLLLAVLAVARFAGILYALPVGVVTILAFDWYFLPPLRNLDGATVLVLGLFLGMSVIVGAVATHTGRRAARSEQARGVLVDEQAALRRVATLVAAGAPAAEVFEAVSAEVAALLAADGAALMRYEPDGTVTAVSGWTSEGGFSNLGIRYPLRMLPLLLFEITWKLIWALAVWLPALLNHSLARDVADNAIGILPGPVVVAILLPWGYLWKQYVVAPGDRWH